MSFESTVSYSGQQMTTSLNGQLRIEQGRGRFVVYDSTTGEQRSVQDVDGFHIFNSGQERSRVDVLGLTTIRADGTYANRVGQASDDFRDGIWTADPNEDLRSLGI